VTKRLIVGLLSIALVVLVGAGPALADDTGGLRHYNFPKHDCVGAVPTHVDLYAHTGGGWMDGRIRYFSGTCAKTASSLHIYTIILWEHTDTYHNIAWSGSHDLDVSSGDATWRTPVHNCSTDPVKGTVHVEVQYRIYWKDGTTTGTRDDNSYEWDANNPLCTG
jgi:hypothetical protein